jgi:hypothetical protein
LLQPTADFVCLADEAQGIVADGDSFFLADVLIQDLDQPILEMGYQGLSEEA